MLILTVFWCSCRCLIKLMKQLLFRQLPLKKMLTGFMLSMRVCWRLVSAAWCLCTPLGCLLLLQDYLGDLSGANAVVLGRSNIVGKPMAQLLTSAHATVTIAHSRTRDLAAICRQADILAAAVGRPEMVKGDWIKPGATVIDVGINRVAAPERGDGKFRLTGDVDFASATEVAGAITPVPGGVGPMTIACLLRNTLVAGCRRRNIALDGYENS